jgi:hypothetical protein
MEILIWVVRPILIVALIGAGVSWLLDSVQTASDHMAAAVTVDTEE